MFLMSSGPPPTTTPPPLCFFPFFVSCEENKFGAITTARLLLSIRLSLE